MTRLAPTSEQQDILDAVAAGGTVAISACAGTGKTATLRMIAERFADRAMLYVAFNKALRADQPIATPNGWREIGTLRVGDEVFGRRWPPSPGNESH